MKIKEAAATWLYFFSHDR